MAKISIVGLGPGNIEQLTIETYELLISADTIYLRTKKHPCAEQLVERGIKLESFDHIYAERDSFSDVYHAIVDQLILLAREKDVVYAVPGNPLTGEETVQLLLDRSKGEGITIEVKTALSFLEPVFSMLGIDPINGVTVRDGSVTLQKPDYKNWIILGQVYNRMVASERKLDLMKYYRDDHQVLIINSAGIKGKQQLHRVKLYEMDRNDWFDHLTSVAIPPAEDPLDGWERLLAVMQKLRGPNGCPWDREQSHLSLRPYLIEESYEVLEALDEQDMHKLREELGDLLLQIIFHSQIAEEADDFTINDVIETITEKLIRRHPHVFSDTKAATSADVVVNWDKIKQEEHSEREFIMDGITKGLPALMLAKKVQAKASKVGFDWQSVEGPIEKISEELEELIKATSHEERAEELGDLFFAVVNLSRFLDIEPELALRGTVNKFILRFNYMEKVCNEQGVKLTDLSLEEMDRLWEEAKKIKKKVENL